jgi:hypothetical protein
MLTRRADGALGVGDQGAEGHRQVMVEDELLALEEQFRHVMGPDGLGRPRQGAGALRSSPGSDAGATAHEPTAATRRELASA